MVTSRRLERGLTEAGVDEEVAAAVADDLETRLAQVATKTDLDRAEDRLHREFGQQREDTNLRFEAMSGEIGQLREDTNQRFDTMSGEIRQLREDTNLRFEAMSGEIGQLREDTNQRFIEQREDTNQRFAELREDMNARFHEQHQMIFRIAWLGVALWSATFGALMYAVFG